MEIEKYILDTRVIAKDKAHTNPIMILPSEEKDRLEEYGIVTVKQKKDRTVVSYHDQNYDLFLTDLPFYETAENADILKGGVVRQNITFDQNCQIENDLFCFGDIIINKDVELSVDKYHKIYCRNLILEGTVIVEGKEFSIKPGTVIGPNTDMSDFTGNCLSIGDTLYIKKSSKGILRRAGTIYASRAIVDGDIQLDGMLVFDDFYIRDNSKIVSRGSWINAEKLIVGDNVTMDFSETELCVLKYDNSLGKGFYSHYDLGDTILGENDRIISDDSFVWLWFGRTEGEFVSISGNAYVKTDKKVYGDISDLNNIDVSNLKRNDLNEKYYSLTYKEKDTEYNYRNSRKQAVDAAVNNAVQDVFKGYFLVDWKKTFLGFKMKKMRSANILYHTIFDLKTLEDFADIVVKAKENQ